jgi:hypothetical protein
MLVAIALLAASPATASAHACWPDGSRTVAKSPHARVYYRQVGRGPLESVYGCLYSRDRSFRLAGDEADGTYTSAFEPFAFAGPYVAFEWHWSPLEPYEPGSWRVQVVDLRDGSTKHSMGAWGGHGPQTYEEGFEPTVVRIRVRRDGAAAWISLWGPKREVRRVDSRGGHRLDHGRHIPGKSLRIDRHRVYWTRDGVAKHASLR